MENKQFDFNKFKTEFSKILSIGINELLITKSEYRKHVENLLDVVQSENEQVSKSFGFILSDQFIHNTNKVIIAKLFSGFSNYSTNFVNLYQYKKQAISTNRNIAQTYFMEIIGMYKTEQEKYHLSNICLWLDKITDVYAK